MAVPWLVIGQLVLGNLDKIIDVVKPAFTRRKPDTPAQPDLVSQQIAELQAATSTNVEQIAQLATQLKEVVAAIAQSATEAAAQREAARRQSYLATALSIAALLAATGAWMAR